MGSSSGKQKNPVMNQATTDPDNPPAYKHLKDRNYPAKFKALAAKHHTDLKPGHYQESPQAVYDDVKRVIQGEKLWKIAAEFPEEHRIEFVATTPLLKFKDDIVVVIEADPNGKGSILHARSKSRIGKGDMGANKARLLYLFGKLNLTPQ
jgi:uncharacterized protein (DUF1499 family)